MDNNTHQLTKQFVDLIIVIPVGPGCKIEFILDTIDSIKYYVHSQYKIILTDDSQNIAVAQEIVKNFPEVIILKNDKNYGKLLGLYMTLCNAYRFALHHFDFHALLRLDTDALIIGHDPELAIIEFFEKNPTVGLAGRYVKGLFSPDDFGNVWHNGGRGFYVAIAYMFTGYFLRNAITYWKIRELIFKGLKQRYELGEFVFGGAYA